MKWADILKDIRQETLEGNKLIVQSIGLMTELLCDAIRSTKAEKRYVLYGGQKCELLGMTDGGTTLNTGGLAFCIILPDGKVKNVQDTECIFMLKDTEL